MASTLTKEEGRTSSQPPLTPLLFLLGLLRIPGRFTGERGRLFVPLLLQGGNQAGHFSAPWWCPENTGSLVSCACGQGGALHPQPRGRELRWGSTGTERAAAVVSSSRSGDLWAHRSRGEGWKQHIPSLKCLIGPH